MPISATLIVQMVTFAVLIVFINRYLWGPLTAIMAKRQKRIADGLAAADAGLKALSEASGRQEEILLLARERAAEILDHAERRSREIIEEARVRARQEAAQALALVQAEAAAEISQMREQLRADVARLAFAGAERIVEREVDRRLHERLLQEVAEKL
ncbi:MAG: F0F1 ATP synthase subunit B [Acidiferrobacter sp.]